jgi:hypothetical protein
MTVEIEKDVSNDMQLRSRIERANRLLEEIIGSAAKTVDVKWYREIPKGRWDLVNLTVSDPTGAQGSTVFASNELAREDYLRSRLYRVWGDLLQSRSHKQLDLLSGTIQTGE